MYKYQKDIQYRNRVHGQMLMLSVTRFYRTLYVIKHYVQHTAREFNNLVRVVHWARILHGHSPRTSRGLECYCFLNEIPRSCLTRPWWYAIRPQIDFRYFRELLLQPRFLPRWTRHNALEQLATDPIWLWDWEWDGLSLCSWSCFMKCIRLSEVRSLNISPTHITPKFALIAFKSCY